MEEKLPVIEAQLEASKRDTIKNWAVSNLPLLNRYVEVVSQTGCCGVCPTCVGTATIGMFIPAAVRGVRTAEGGQDAIKLIDETDDSISN
jgi:hypothetical protein